MDDFDLLNSYVRDRSEDAFRQLVDRHVGMVFRTALRVLNDSELAEEVTQTAFTMLAQKGVTIRRPQIVGGWLYHTTKNLTMNVVRAERRRRVREQTAADMELINAPAESPAILEQLEPAMTELSREQQDVLVLRFFENRSFKEVGSEIGISEDAARMRVQRALEDLRDIFGRRGVAVSAVVLTGALAVTNSTALPAGLAAGVAVAAAKSTIAGGVVTAVSWLNAKSIAAVVAGMMVASGGTYIVLQQQLTREKEEVAKLTSQNTKLVQEAKSTLAAAEAKERELNSVQVNQSELSRLRAEVTRLKAQSQSAHGLSNSIATTPAPLEPQPVPTAGKYVIKEELTFAGYDTPEATLQTMHYGLAKGDLEALKNCHAKKAKFTSQELASLKEGQQYMNRALLGYQIRAKKTVALDKAELNYAMKLTPEFAKQMPPSLVIKMTKINNAWTVDDSPEPFPKDWDREGEIQRFVH